MPRRTTTTSAGLVLLLLSALAGNIDYAYTLPPGPPPGAYVDLSPEVQDVSALGSAVYNLTVRSEWSFEGWVNLTLGDLPDGVTVKMIDAVYIQRGETVETQLFVTVSPFVRESQITISVMAEVEIDSEPFVTSTEAQLNVVSSVTTVTRIVTRNLGDRTLTVTVLSTTTSTTTVFTTVTETRTLVESEPFLTEINSLLERGNDGVQTVSIGAGISVAGVAIAIALRKRR